MKVMTVVRARPQFIKAATDSKKLRMQSDVLEILVHTGQHIDPEMSDNFLAKWGVRSLIFILVFLGVSMGK